MVIQSITQLGNPIIRSKSKIVKDLTSKQTKKIIQDLTDSMRHHGLVGMAAPQIGINLRIFVTEIRDTKSRAVVTTDPVRIFINPKIISYSRTLAWGYEGCGSVAESGLFGSVQRHSSVVVKALDQNGKIFTLKTNGLLARIIQHETDHLDGIVFLDRVKDSGSFYSRNEYISKFKKPKI